MEPDADRFRALARPAPWRFRTLRWTHCSRRPGEDDVPVQAWLKRPGRLLVVDGDGRRHVERGLPYTTSRLSIGGGGWLGRNRRPAPAVDRVRPTPDAVDGYDPRCTCCALLWGEGTAAMLARSGGPPLLPTEDLPEAHEVILDVQTGIVVRARALGGKAPGVGFDTEINEVDAPMDDDLFR